jgi:outer membrane protein TolC
VPWDATKPLTLSLADALQIGARNSREYQARKELVFQTALALDLERDRFRQTWVGLLNGGLVRDLGADPATTTVSGGGDIGVTKRLLSGAAMSVNLAVDLVKLLTQGDDSAFGILADATIAVPLLRGSGEFVVSEPLRQSEREVIYSIYDFERFKRGFAVQLATEYYSVLELLEEVDNQHENYKWLIEATRRAHRMAEAQRSDQIQVDQTEQDELEARDTWVQALRAYESRLDGFKLLLGLPVDARVELERSEFEQLVALTAFHSERSASEHVPADAPVEIVPPSREGGGPFELAPEDAVQIALRERLDLRIAIGRIFDAQRAVAVAADGLRPDLTLLGNASMGEARSGASGATLPSADLRPDKGTYSFFGLFDLGLERTAERNLYRNAQIDFEALVRAAQAAEDQVKFEVRENLRVLQEARERLQIQAQSLQLAQRRVDITSRFLDAGRAEARDVLEAQSDLVDAKNVLALERVRYRLAELALQRDLELLQVGEDGLWTELDPTTLSVAPQQP